MEKKYNIIELIYRNKTINNIDKKIKLLGINNNIDVYTFLKYRLIITIITFIVIIYLSKIGYIVAPIISIAIYYLMEYLVIDTKLKQRTITLEKESITYFEILLLSLNAGRNLEGAITVTNNNTKGQLTDEFIEAIREIKYGKSLNEALLDTEKRIPSDNINNIILSLIEKDDSGTSITRILHKEIDYLREKRKLHIKSEIDKLPLKISVISVLFFVPLMLLIILGPVILLYIK